MASIIYGKKVLSYAPYELGKESLQTEFDAAIHMNQHLTQGGYRLAYGFIDPLMNHYEAGNRFYFDIFGCKMVDKLSYYRTGAGSIHAVTDASRQVDQGIVDAVFLFGYDPLLSDKNTYGGDAIKAAMNVLDGDGIVSYYNTLSEHFCHAQNLSAQEFAALADALFDNYSYTYETHNIGKRKPRQREKTMEKAGGSLFCLTDCANPNLDFAGGLIICNDTVADALDIPKQQRIEIKATAQAMVGLSVESLKHIAGSKATPFPHLRHVVQNLEFAAELSFIEELQKGNLILDAYTCYPPIPMAFLLTGGFVPSLEALPDFLKTYEITVTGGMNLAGAPWNNPVINGLVTMYHRLISSKAEYGLVHGNGGIGEAQGLILLQRTASPD